MGSRPFDQRHILKMKLPYNNSQSPISDPQSAIRNPQSEILLSKSYKGKYPFRIGTTSYIYPDHMLPNVRKIGPFVDEIELLLFESAPESLPTPGDVASLLKAANEHQITYNIHLPIDIYLGSSEAAKRRQAVEILINIFDLTFCLAPSTYTLHLEYDMPSYGEADKKQWQENICISMEALLSHGIPASTISIETLTYPYPWIENIISEFNLSVCLDVGHLLKNDVHLEKAYRAYEDRVSIIHLHARIGNDDHKPLDMLSTPEWMAVLGILKQFRGIVSLEVFCLEHLEVSLKLLAERFFDR